jgi:hypothetical protein
MTAFTVSPAFRPISHESKYVSTEEIALLIACSSIVSGTDEVTWRT